MTFLRLRVDWWGTLGRVGTRYWTAVPGWGVGVVAWALFTALGVYESGGKDHRHSLLWPNLRILKAPFPSVSDTLFLFTREALPSLMGASFVLSLVPLPKDYVLGNEGEVAFALLTPLILLLVTGLVTVSWWMICVVIWPIRKLGPIVARYIRL
jgi:GPI inositol-deacylase